MRAESKTQASYVLSAVVFLSLVSCAFTPERKIIERSPVYLSSEGKDGYVFSVLLSRHIERKQGELTRDPSTAHSHIHLQGPRCHRSTLLLDQQGTRTDFRISCTVNYKIIRDDQVKEGISSARNYFINTPHLSAYYRREEELINKLKERLAQQLIRVLVSL